MGATGSGKSSFINLACGSDAVTASDDIESCTETVEEAPPFVLDGQQVKLFDTPSFDHTNRSPHEILQIISEALENQYRKGTKLHGIIFMHPIDAIRINSLAKENFSVFTRLCGTTALKNVVIVANKWPKAQNRRDKFEHRLERLSSSDELFAFAVSNGAHIQKHLEQTAGSAHAIIREMLKNQPIPLAIQEEMVDHHKSIDETTAGIKLNEKSADTMKQLEEKIKLQLKDDEAARRRALEDELSAKIQAYEDKNKKLQDMIAKKKAKIVALQKELEAEINARQESDTDEQADTQPTMYHSIVSGGNHTMQITSGHSFYAAPNLTNKLVEGTPLRTHKVRFVFWSIIIRQTIL
ncbi:hypothetical protein HYPSUDRAFT_67422 [Hypholoma sublateritium FD-334 SS-4]|uniref:G domain-containing protein n=1 Tax=Hypholoma sublateritium (strain FD-334 SS-4) TaxID=945553 RepID=A0A0D2NST8_HYPSF|nr:hypothetical protein HYPSUDRAFT_67422 [Hypholoma sublateritium FD-334 SS-4]